MDYYTKVKNHIERTGISKIVEDTIIIPGYDNTPFYKVYLKNGDCLMFGFKNKGWFFDNGIFHMRFVTRKTDQTLMVDDYYQKKDIKELIVGLYNEFMENLFD